jgi:hypothetical protein
MATAETTDSHVVGYIPRDADSCLARHGIMYGLAAAFPGTIVPDDIGFGLPVGPDRTTPVTCESKQMDDAQSDLAFQWVCGFCQGYKCRPTY